MKKLLVLALLTSPCLAEEGRVSECSVYEGIPAADKALQEVISLNSELNYTKGRIQGLADELRRSGGPSMAKAAQGLGEISSRLDEVSSDFRQALASISATEGILNSLTLAQAHLVGAMSKYRPVKLLDLDQNTKAQVLCLENETKAINSKLKDILAGLN
jgi:hypothetical protein